MRQMQGEVIVRCDMCRRTAHRFDTILMDTKKGRMRLCRDCQFKKYMGELREKNPNIDIKLSVEQFSKGIKEGKDGRR